MAKQILGYIKLQIPAGAANPAPPVGPALGQKGVNIMDFCKKFNDSTKDMEKNVPIPVTITVYKDKSFDFVKKLPPVSYYLKKFSGVKKGSGLTGKEFAGKIKMSDIREIAKLKMPDLNAFDEDAAARMIQGSAMAMGLNVVGS